MYDSGEEDIVQDIVGVGWAAFQWSQKSREDWVDEVDWQVDRRSIMRTALRKSMLIERLHNPVIKE